ncbi:MAG: monovalent cation/H(+) antiporter subunit G [Bacillota bacterium]
MVASLLLLVGTVFSLLGAVGLVRFPDVFSRTHATAMSTTLGTLGVVLAGTVYFGAQGSVPWRLLLVIPFLFWTSTAGGFVLRRAAHRTGVPLAPETVQDDPWAPTGTLEERYRSAGHRIVQGR